MEELRKITLMIIERSRGWRGHPLHFTVEKTEAKREEEKLFAQIYYVPNGILKFPSQPYPHLSK